MAKRSTEKLKLLYVLKILQEETNDQHRLSSAEIVEKLAAYGIEAERKSVYRDLDVLEDIGYDIVRAHSGIFLAGGIFETAELKLLSDAVQASRFITEKKSSELIEKLTSLTDKYTAAGMRRSVYINDRPKAENEAIYYTVDTIHNAISQNRCISFLYFDWNVKKEKVLRHGGARYSVSPWGLLRDDEKYYMLAYDNEAGQMKHFRTDKMLQTALTAEERRGEEEFAGTDLGMYSKKMFGMYSGDEDTVTLRCDNSLAGVIIDRFGSAVGIYPVGGGHFNVSVRVNVSDNFLSWVMQFGKRMKISSPADVRERMKKFISDAGEMYK